ncbi:MAG TPA: hypothetical protein VGE47_07295 [Burkholderiaceae bacterium]
MLQREVIAAEGHAIEYKLRVVDDELLDPARRPGMLKTPLTQCHASVDMAAHTLLEALARGLRDIGTGEQLAALQLRAQISAVLAHIAERDHRAWPDLQAAAAIEHEGGAGVGAAVFQIDGRLLLAQPEADLHHLDFPALRRNLERQRLVETAGQIGLGLFKFASANYAKDVRCSKDGSDGGGLRRTGRDELQGGNRNSSSVHARSLCAHQHPNVGANHLKA